MMGPLRIVFTASDTLVGRLIRWLSRSDVSHVMLEYESELWGGRWVVEAHMTGVRTLPAEKRKHDVVAEYDITCDIDDAFPWMRRYIGVGYDFRSFFFVGAMLFLWRVFNRRIRAPLTPTNTQLCSELVGRLLIHAAFPGTSKWQVEKVLPRRLKRYCERHPDLFQKVQSQ